MLSVKNIALSIGWLTCASLASTLHAQSNDPGNVADGLRREFARPAGEHAPEQFDDTLVVDTSSLDAENEKLLAAEQQLLNKSDSLLVSTPATFQSAPAKSENSQKKIQQDLAQPIQEKTVINAPAIDEAPPLERASLRAVGEAIEKEKSEKKKLEARLRESDSRSKNLQQELAEVKNRLMIAETEVERLSSLLEARNRAAESSMGAAPRNEQQPMRVVSNKPQREAPKVQGNSTQGQTAVADVPVASVISEKAYLRSGPGKGNAPLMSVPRGTRLVVETRDGDWYRVVTPTGSRAWVASEVLAFGVDASTTGASRTVRIRGYDSSLSQ